MTTEQQIREVVAVSLRGATVRTGGENVVLPWGTLRAAAKQDDAELASEYSTLLSQALASAAALKEVSVGIENDTNTPHGFAAVLRDVAGEFVTGRTVAADFGLSGSRWEAEQDVARAKDRLEKKGYVIHTA